MHTAFQDGAATAEPLLVAESVTKVYRTGTQAVVALDNRDPHGRRGELLAVMGPSGSGKDDAAQLPVRAGRHRLWPGVVEGRDLFAMSDHDRTAHRAHSMGFVFQAFNLIPVLK